MWTFFKSKVSINNKQILVELMTGIIELLRDNAYSAQANAFRKPLGYLLKDDIANFVKYLNTADIWGGSGAAWEVYLTPKKTELKFMQLMVDLVDNLKETGIKIPMERGVTDLFKEELSK